MSRSQLYGQLGCRAKSHFAQNFNVYTNQTTKHACDAKNTEQMDRPFGRAARATKEQQRIPSKQVKQKELETVHVSTCTSTFHALIASDNAQICRYYRQTYAFHGKIRNDPDLYMRFWRSRRSTLASFPYLKIHRNFHIFAFARFRLDRRIFRFSLHFQLI